MIKRILVGLGGTPYTGAAIRWAVDLARTHGAALTGVTVLDLSRLMVGAVPLLGGASVQVVRQRFSQIAREQVETAIEQFIAACEAAQVNFSVQQEEGDPFDLLVGHARYHDLMIFGLRSLFEYGLVEGPHDVLVRLVSEGVRPIMAVSPAFMPIRRVLIAYSGSMESAKTMKSFVQLRLWPDAHLRIVTFEHPQDKAQELLSSARRYFQAHGLDPEVDHVPVAPRDRLLSYAAEWNADLIVIGNSARNLLLRKLFGETALKAIQEAKCPLFLGQ